MSFFESKDKIYVQKHQKTAYFQVSFISGFHFLSINIQIDLQLLDLWLFSL